MSEPAAGGRLESVAWFPAIGSPKRDRGVVRSLIKLAIGAAVGLLLFLAGHPHAAYGVWTLAGLLGGASLVSPVARRAIDGALSRFGRAVGEGLGTVLLTIVYLFVLTPTRFARRALGADDLHLRDAHRPSYWLPCDDPARKARWAGAMFATEAPRAGAHPLRAAALAAITLALLAEGVARLYGFGHTVLYYADPDIGYYPEPNAELVRYGGRVATNAFGMRSPQTARTKPAGVFRILMLGDSTLYGGSYVDQEDMYATVVRRRLNGGLGTTQPIPGGKVEVLAMGCNGWGPFHERGFVKKYPDAFQADLALVMLPIDDVTRPLYGLMEVPFFPVQAPPRFGLEEVWNHLVWRYRKERAGKDQAWEARQAEQGIREYGLLVDDLARAGSEVMVFVQPTRKSGFGGAESGMDGPWREALTETVARRGVKTFSARGFFAGRGTPEAIYHDEVHLSGKGHRAYAELIEATIREESTRFRRYAHASAEQAAGGP